MSAPSPARKNNHHEKTFTVGVVGASDKELGTIKRILTVTQYRTRGYQLVRLGDGQVNRRQAVDIVLMCSLNPSVIDLWQNGEANKPMVIFSRPDSAIRSNYQLQLPINPSKLIKMLDRYTIKELNFFPEFEIGKEADLDLGAASGIEILKENQQDGKKSIGRALIADDSLAVRKQMQIEFDLLNSGLDTVEDGQAAIDEAQHTKYDIVFLDVVMPGVDGYTACKKIKRSKLNKNTPVIMLTSKSSSFDKIKGTLAGCDAYLVKPINHNEFESIYQKHTQQKGN